MLAVVMILSFIIVMAFGRTDTGGLNLSWRSRAAADSGTGTAADSRTEYRTALPAHAVSHRRTGSPAQCAAEHCAAIYRVGTCSSRK
jgi:hypothetical protein